MKDNFTRAKDSLAEQRIRAYLAQQENAKEKQTSAPVASSTSVTSSTPAAPRLTVK